MTGDATIELGQRVLHARATANEAAVAFGPESLPAFRAKSALRAIQREAREALS